MGALSTVRETVDFTALTKSAARTALQRHKKNADVDEILVISLASENLPNMKPFAESENRKVGQKRFRTFSRQTEA